MCCDDEPEAGHVFAFASFVFEDALGEESAGPAAEHVEFDELFFGDAPGISLGSEFVPAVLEEAEEAEEGVPAEDREKCHSHGVIVGCSAAGVVAGGETGW